nr:DUF4189 domain-containing protein [uncultured Paraburkholderia sp.]
MHGDSYADDGLSRPEGARCGCHEDEAACEEDGAGSSAPQQDLEIHRLRVSALLAGPLPLLAQCAPGIPCAGNPGGIPPSAPNSPYNNHAGDYPTAGNSNASPRWRDSWGAVAMDDDSGAAGVAVNEESKSSANATAMKQCSMNGSAHCKVIISYYNQCVSVAQQHNGGFIIAAGRAEQADADRYTLSQCAKHGTCEIVYHACSYAVRLQ